MSGKWREPIDTLDEMTCGAIGARLRCGSMMHRDDDPEAFDETFFSRIAAQSADLAEIEHDPGTDREWEREIGERKPDRRDPFRFVIKSRLTPGAGGAIMGAPAG